MKTERRHELERNALADWLATQGEFIQRYSQAILASLLAVVVIVGAWIYMTRRSASQTASAWDQVYAASASGDFDALQRLADRDSSTAAGQWARLRVADHRLNEGINLLFDDRAASQKALTEAVTNYRAVAEKSSELDTKQHATLGLARAYESQDKLAEAREQYETVVKQWADTVYGKEAEQRLSDLNRHSTKQFYDWFAQREAKPAEGPGVPGVRPKFDSSALPNEGDFKFSNGPAAVPGGDGKESGTSQAKKPAEDASDQK